MWTEGVGLAIIASFAIVFVKYKRRKNSNTLYSSKCASKKKIFLVYRYCIRKYFALSVATTGKHLMK